jgi:hypothetical protein
MDENFLPLLTCNCRSAPCILIFGSGPIPDARFDRNRFPIDAMRPRRASAGHDRSTFEADRRTLCPKSQAASNWPIGWGSPPPGMADQRRVPQVVTEEVHLNADLPGVTAYEGQAIADAATVALRVEGALIVAAWSDRRDR